MNAAAAYVNDNVLVMRMSCLTQTQGKLASVRCAGTDICTDE